MYEPNIIYIEDGIIDGFSIMPIINRKYYLMYENNIQIKNSNFYNERVLEKYDFVYCYRFLHEKHNKDIPMRRKMRKLMSSVKEGGYIYIYYHMAKNEEDFSNFSRNQYFREGEIMDYFDPQTGK